MSCQLSPRLPPQQYPVSVSVQAGRSGRHCQLLPAAVGVIAGTGVMCRGGGGGQTGRQWPPAPLRRRRAVSGTSDTRRGSPTSAADPPAGQFPVHLVRGRSRSDRGRPAAAPHRKPSRSGAGPSDAGREQEVAYLQPARRPAPTPRPVVVRSEERRVRAVWCCGGCICRSPAGETRPVRTHCHGVWPCIHMAALHA